MDIVVWLRSLGLGMYEAAFRDNDIDETVPRDDVRSGLIPSSIAASRLVPYTIV
jgi:hypothetical protein